MPTPKDQVTASIIAAGRHLEQALADLEHLPAFDPGAIAYAAHALGNFLLITGGTVDLLLVTLENYPDPQVRTWLEGLRHAANLMTHTVNQLMGTAVREGPQLRPEKVDLPVLVRRGCDYYQRLANRKQIAITFESTVETPHVWADRVAVAAVLDNLLSNAVKYSPHGKTIRIQVRSEPGYLVCSIRDEGPGLSAEERARLFQRGVRLSAVPTGGEPSAGYGLAVAKELMDRLGGQITCESEPGQGACFSMRLPIYREDLAAGGLDGQGPAGMK
jgi:signal transduction histidine kinase